MTYGYGASTVEKIELPDTKNLIIDDFTLAFFLGIRNKTLWYMLNEKKKLYQVFRIPKKSGDMRIIHAPAPMMKYVLRQAHIRLLTPLQEKLGPHVTAYRENKSIVDAVKLHIPDCPVCDSTPKGITAKKHECPRYGAYIHMDLKNFFGSTSKAWVRNYFISQGYSFYVSGLMANLLTVDDIPNVRYRKTKDTEKPIREFFTGIPQGSPASGAICNLVADRCIDGAIIKRLQELDAAQNLTGEYRWRYSRYADDITLTCGVNHPRAVKVIIANDIADIVHKGGYAVNREKTRIGNSYYRKTLLGIVFNEKPNVPKEEYLKVRAIVHNCLTQGLETQVERAHRKDPDDLIHFLRGKIAFFSQVIPEKAEKINAEFQVACSQYTKKELTDAAVSG